MSETIDEAAAGWFAAQDSDAMDWDAFTTWLEADPRHRVAFDAMARIDDDIARYRTPLTAPQPKEVIALPRRRAQRWVLGGGAVAVAAALALAISLPRSAPDQVWASAATSRTVALPDGVAVTLAPRSRLSAASGDTTRLALDGSAYFDIAHRPDRPLAIAMNGYVVRDIGTRFTVAGGDGVTRVAVAEGRVTIAGARLNAPVALDAGREFVATAGGARLGAVAPGDVGSWRNGTLVYADAPLALVVADIARYSGSTVSVDPAVADRRLTGTLTIGDGSGLAAAVGAILDIDVRRDSRGVRLQPRT